MDDVYTIGILNFEFPHNEYPADSYRHEIKLKDVEDNHVFYEKLTFIYLEMPKFVKTEDELETMFDKWMFVLHNLYRLLERPKALQDRVFQKLFEQAEIARYSEIGRRQYEDSKKVFWDNYSVIKTAEQKGAQKEKLGTIHRMKAKGFSVENISEIAGLTIEEVKGLLQ